MPYAGFWRRFLALLVDGILINLALYAIDTVTGGAVYEDVATHYRSPYDYGYSFGIKIEYTFFGWLISFFGSWLYFAGLESSAGRATLGKRALGIVVTDLNGNRVSFGRATGRYFGKILSGITLLIGFLMAAFTRQKQALHDMIAGTLVMKRYQIGPAYDITAPAPPPPPPSRYSR